MLLIYLGWFKSPVTVLSQVINVLSFFRVSVIELVKYIPWAVRLFVTPDVRGLEETPSPTEGWSLELPQSPPGTGTRPGTCWLSRER